MYTTSYVDHRTSSLLIFGATHMLADRVVRLGKNSLTGLLLGMAVVGALRECP